MDLNLKLQTLRERSGLGHREMARLCGISPEHYYDLESFPSDLRMTVSLVEIERLCHVLRCSIRSLLKDTEEVARGRELFRYQEIAATIRAYLEEHYLSAEEFGERCGWDIAGAIADHEAAHEWNVDCLWDIAECMGRGRAEFLDGIVEGKEG